MGVHDNHDNQGLFIDTDVITSTIGVDYGEVKVISLDKPKDFYDMCLFILVSQRHIINIKELTLHES